LVLGKNGIYGGVYYENGNPVPYKGLIEWEGNLYYINDGGRVVIGRYFISRLNGLKESGGAYYFDENGAMVGTGVYEGYYYEDGKATPYAGMVTVGEDTYYIEANAKVKTGRYAPVKNNGFAKGIYCFGEDGKMLTNVVVDGYYYGEDGLSIAYRGLVKVGESYYYVNDSGKVVTGRKYFVSKTNGLKAAGFYTFDEYGRLATSVSNEEELKDAIENGDGSIILDGDIDLSGGIIIG